MGEVYRAHDSTLRRDVAGPPATATEVANWSADGRRDIGFDRGYPYDVAPDGRFLVGAGKIVPS